MKLTPEQVKYLKALEPSVKFQYWGLGVCTAILGCALVFGWYLSTQANKCSGQLIRQPEGLYCFSNLGQIQEDDVK